jgi:hypothetical protein
LPKTHTFAFIYALKTNQESPLNLPSEMIKKLKPKGIRFVKDSHLDEEPASHSLLLQKKII